MSGIVKRIVSGIQPSGTLHLGNYLGAVKEWKRLVNENQNINNSDKADNEKSNNRVKSNNDSNCNELKSNISTTNSIHTKSDILYFIADYHSLTTRLSKERKGEFLKTDNEGINNNINNLNNLEKDDNESLEKLSLNTLACLIASGINPNKCTLFLQSSIPFHTELQWILSCITSNSWLNTMIQFKEKKIDSNGLYSYPILMAADVLLYKGSHVPVGVDQLQHLELMAKIAERMNKTCKKKIFNIPKPIFSNQPKVMSLTNASKKMSKSDPSQLSLIYLTENKETISKKILKAKTDSIGSIKYDFEKRPELANLISIYSAITGKSFDEVEKIFDAANTYEFKLKLIEVVCAEILPISEKANKLIKHENDYLLDILREGEKVAFDIAKNTIGEVKETLKVLSVPKIMH